MREAFGDDVLLTDAKGLLISSSSRVIQIIPNCGKSFDKRTWTACCGLEIRLDGNTHYLNREEVDALYAALVKIKLLSGEIV